MCWKHRPFTLHLHKNFRARLSLNVHFNCITECFITARVRSTTGGYIFSLFVCSQGGGTRSRSRWGGGGTRSRSRWGAHPGYPPSRSRWGDHLGYPPPSRSRWGARPGYPPSRSRWGPAQGTPHPGLGGGLLGVPPHPGLCGGPCPGYLPRWGANLRSPPAGGGAARGTPPDQHSVYLLHGGRYASCVHVGGLSCLLIYYQLYSQINSWMYMPEKAVCDII